MRFEFGPETHGPEMASAEALQQIAVQLERIADALVSVSVEAQIAEADVTAEEILRDHRADGGAEVVPWCSTCQSFSVPVADGSCGQCGSTVEFAEVDRWA